MDSAAAYEIYARDFMLGRDKSEIGARVVDKWSRTLKDKGTLIELGSGAGYPITRVLHANGQKIWAVDSSPTLVSVFKDRFPAIPVQCVKVQGFDFFGMKFDAAVAIGLLFLLSEEDQIQLISSVASRLNPGGRFLFTAPIEIGEWKDLNTGIACKSLGQEFYDMRLTLAGFRVLSNYVDQGRNNYYDVERLT